MVNAHPHPVAGDAGTLPGLRQIWGILVRRKWIVSAVVLLVVGLTALATWRQAPTYRSEARIRIDEQRQGILGQVSPFNPTGSKSLLATEMLELRSYRIASEVVDSLSLQVEMAEPRAARESLLTVLVEPKVEKTTLFELARSEDGSYAMEGRRIVAGQPFALAGGRLSLRRELASAGPEKIVLRVLPTRLAIERLQAKVEVYRPDPDAQIISIRYRSRDRLISAAVPNVMTERFVVYKSRTNRAKSESMVGFLEEQVGSYASQLRVAEDALRVFRERAQIVEPKEQATVQVRQLAELQAQRDRLESERESLRRLLTAAETSARNPSERSPYRQLAAFPTFLGNLAVQDILRSLNTLETQQTDLLGRRTPENPDVQVLDQRRRELERQLHRLAVNYLNSLDSQLTSLRGTLSRFSGEVGTVPGVEVEYARLLRQKTLLEQIYTLLQTRLKESQIQYAAEPSDVRVIDDALVPNRPFTPQPVRSIAIALVLGMLLAVGAAVAAESMDNKVHSRGDVEAVTGGLPILGLIPPIPMELVASTNGKAHVNGNAKGRPNLAGGRLVARSAPFSPASEAYRALRTSVTFAGIERAPQLVVITSALPGDGKSTSASNLAVTIAQQGVRTLLVDGDLRRGVLHETFGIPQEPGLAHVLLGVSTLEDAIREVAIRDDVPALHVLASGAFPPNPAEVLGSPRMLALMEQLRARYDVVVFDAPPLNLVTDAAVLGKQSDAVVLVTRAGATEKIALRHAVQQLHQLRAPLIGVVLNNYDKAHDSYYGYGESYGGPEVAVRR